MIHLGQLREQVIRPVLKDIGLWSQASENLLIGTGLIESRFYYLKQIKGEALSLFQIEVPTYYWIIHKIANRSNLYEKVLKVLGYDKFPPPERLMSDIALSLIIARYRYCLDPDPLPEAENIIELSKYYKKIYNTPLGKADPQLFVSLYREHELKFPSNT